MKKQLLILVTASLIHMHSTAQPGGYIGLTDSSRHFIIDINAVGATLGLQPSHSTGRLNGKDVFTGNSWGSTYSDEIQIDGQNVIKCSVNQGSTGEGLGGSVNLSNHQSSQTTLVKGDEIWIRTKVRFPSDSWQWNQGRNKFFRLRYKDAGGGNYTDLYVDGNKSMDERQIWWISEQENSWTAPPHIGDLIFPDVDHTVEMHIVIDDLSGPNGGMALQRVWIDGVLHIDGTKRTLKLEGGSYFMASLFMYYGNDTAPANLHFYMKDFIVQSFVPDQRDAAGNPFIGIGVSTDIKEQTNIDLQIYPNPANDYITISGLSPTGEASIYISNALGQQVGETQSFTNRASVKLQTNHLPKGIYILTINHNNKECIHKIIKN